MAMLERYRKPGGFVQLLALIETCNPSKQEKLLETIAKEDRVWAETIRAKMISIDRIFSWSDDALMEIFGTLQDLTVGVTLFAADEALKARINGFVTHGRKRKIEDLFGSSSPSPAEVSATHMKIVESVRRMGSEGFLRFEKFDLQLVIDQDIDDRLLHRAGPSEAVSMKPAPSADAMPRVLHSYSPLSAHQPAAPKTHGPTSGPNESRLMELQLIKKRVADLSKENAVLRHELSMAKSKLDQIKKIA